MAGDLQEIFQLALNYFYKTYKKKGGTQQKLAAKLNVSQSYISAVLQSTKKASTELQEKFANVLYGPYEDFLAVGRRIKNGLKPELITKSDRDDEVESLIIKLSHYIRDYQRIEKELIDIKNFYKILIEKMPSGVFVTDQNDNIFFVNTWLLNKIGIPRKSFIGNNVLNTTKNFPMAKIGELQQYYIRAKETYEEHEFHQIKLITASGKEAYRSGWCIPILEHSEYKGMIVTLGDITEEVLLKQKLHEETIIMKAAMDSFDQVGWIILDKQKRIIKRNAVYRKKFKIPEEILNENDLRKNFEWTKQFVCDPDKFMQLSLEILLVKKKVIHEFDMIDGSRVSRVSSPLVEDDEIIGWSILLHDISQRK